MTPDEARKLLGGYATGSLTEAERTALFQAALEDQELFDELAGEQVLKEVLDEPGARQRLIAALESPRKHRAWLWVTAAATVAVAVVIGIVVSNRTPPPPEQIAQVLKSPEPVAAPVAPPAVALAPAPEPVKPKVAPGPPPPPPIAELQKAEAENNLADQVQQAKPQAAGGAIREFSAAAPTAGAARAQNETVTVTTEVATYFSYVDRPDGSLQIVILKPGFLSVTALFIYREVDIFPSAAVAPPRTIQVQIPSGATSVVVGFSKTAGINEAPIRKEAATGFGIDLNPSYGKIRIQLPTPVSLTPATR